MTPLRNGSMVKVLTVFTPSWIFRLPEGAGTPGIVTVTPTLIVFPRLTVVADSVEVVVEASLSTRVDGAFAAPSANPTFDASTVTETSLPASAGVSV